MEVSSQRHALAALLLGKRPVTRFTGGWVGPRVGLGFCGKTCPPSGFDPRTFHLLASRYTD
jgi:hypothetical protein